MHLPSGRHAHKTKRPKNLSVQLLAISCAPAFLVGCSSQPTVSQSVPMGPVPVTVAPVVVKSVPVEIRAIGNVEAFSTVSVKAQVAGTIEQAFFREGQDVKKGDLLFKLDERPFRATLQQLEANLARNQAELENAKAQSERYAKLYESGIVSKEQFDSFRTNADALAAAVRADQAAIERARIDLEYCTILSPIDGRTGSLLFHPGNIVKSNETVLVVINQVNPIYVSFSVPEQHLAEIKRRLGGGRLPVTATIPGETRFPATGALSFVDNAVDPSTGTIRLKATFDNQGRQLWPGQFVNVSLRLSTQEDAVVIPSQAVQTGQSGFYAYIVKPDMRAELRPIVPGNQVGGETVIERGLEAGETVVTDGQLRLFPDAKVEFKNP
jgi:multidrug efflux system membrane fusion protein